MKTSLMLAIVALHSIPCSSQPVSVAPWMTGQRLVDLQRTPPGVMNATQLSHAQYLDDQRAESYMDGVHDATEGLKWCYSYKYKPKPGTIKEAIIWGLRAMTPEQLKRNAADLIVEILIAKYPCTGSAKAAP